MEEKRIYTFSHEDWDDPVLLKLTKKQARFINWFLQETTLDYNCSLEDISTANVVEFEEED